MGKMGEMVYEMGRHVMVRYSARLVLAALIAALALAPAAARADDTDLFVKSNVPPNVLILLDTSRSMTWYNKDGGTVGDEFAGVPGRTGSRMWIAKDVLNEVVAANADKINFGLAAYQQGTAATNVRALGTPPRAWYYSEGSSKVPFSWLAYTYSNRYYYWPWYFDLRTPQAGLGGPASASDPAGYDPATLKPNSPSFTLAWSLRTDVSPNPTRFKSDGVPEVWQDRCLRHYEISYNNQVTWSYWYNPGSDVAAGCPSAGGLIGGIGYSPERYYSCTFNRRLTYDTPTPYEYLCGRYTDSALDGTTQYDYKQDQIANYTRSFQSRYNYRLLSDGVQNVVTQNARPDRYMWRYYYTATCVANCKNTGNFWTWTWDTPYYPDDATCKAGSVNNPWTDPATLGVSLTCTSYRNAGQPAYTLSATGTWAVPVNYEYKWQGNNYELATDNSCSGGRVLVDVGSGTLSEIKNYLGKGTDPAKELHAANNSTPLAGVLDTATTYFTNPDGVVMTDALKQCRKNFAIMVTDGGDSCLIDLTVPGQKAQALANLSNLPGGVKTYVVGIDQGGLSTDERNALTSIAFKGGTGNFYSAGDRAALLSALETILGQILSQSYSFAPPIVPRMRVRDNLIAIQGAMLPNTASNVPFWKGFLAAYQLRDDGTLPTDANHLLDATQITQYWEASAILNARSPDDRKMYTSRNVQSGSNWTTEMVPFISGATVNSLVGCPGSFTLTEHDINNDGALNTTDCDLFVQLLRGSNAFVNWGSKLGDVFHSQPVIVGSPSATYVDTTFDPANPSANLALSAAPSTYKAFRDAHSTRTRVVLVGANDGFLHAFNAGNWDTALAAYDAGTGAEEWAYTPPNLNAALKSLGSKSGAHRYFVDGTPKVADVWLDDNNDGTKALDGTEWHTVALVALRQGGTGIFHLDITDTVVADTRGPRPLTNGTNQYPTYYSTCGQSWSEPAIGKVKVQIGGRKVDRWVAFFGDGFNTDPLSTTCGREFHVIDLKTGQHLWRLGNQVSGTMQTVPEMQYDVMGSPIALDLNGDGYVDRVYIGDRGGQIWRFDVSAVGANGGNDVDPRAGTRVNNWVVSRLFAGPTTQMFAEKPAAALDERGNVWVFAATGDRANPLSAGDPDDAVDAGKGRDGRLFGIMDTYPGRVTPWAETDLTDVTGVNTLNPADIPGAGWRIKLDKTEKNFTPVEVFNKVVFFGTVKPGATITGAGCTTSPATARLYQIYYLTGGGVTDMAAFQSATPTPSNRSVELGTGAPVRSLITTLSLGGSGVLITGTGEQAVRFATPSGADGIFFNAPINLRQTRYWRVN